MRKKYSLTRIQILELPSFQDTTQNTSRLCLTVQEDLSEIRFSKKHRGTVTIQNRWATWLLSCTRPVAVAIHIVLDEVRWNIQELLVKCTSFMNLVLICVFWDIILYLFQQGSRNILQLEKTSVEKDQSTCFTTT
jgi:hypothetical protein